MIELYPNLSTSLAGLYRCPIDGAYLDLHGFTINGMRNLVKGACPRCRRRYYADLPVKHGLFSPFVISAETGEVFESTARSWFSQLLEESWRNRRDEEVEFAVTRHRNADEIVLVNCLDFLYGHCLLALLNVQLHLDHHSHLGCVALVPKQLESLVPEGVAETWVVDLPLSKFRHWYYDLEQKISAEISRFARCYMSMTYSHPHFSRYDIDRFVQVDNTNTDETSYPSIVFSYREDRLWGRNLRDQGHNLDKLHAYLRVRYPQLSFALVGLGHRTPLPQGMKDLRFKQVTPEIEQQWFAALRGADCAVGIHGSNMLLASGLARAVVELLPEDRYGNILQDLLFDRDRPDLYDNLLRVRLLHGSNTLHDISTQRVGAVISSQLKHGALLRAEMSLELQPAALGGHPIDPTPLVAAYAGLQRTAGCRARKVADRARLHGVSGRIRARMLQWRDRLAGALLSIGE